MTRQELNAHRHPSEAGLFWLTMIVIVPVCLAAILFAFESFTVALIAVTSIIVSTWIVMKMLTARFLGNCVKVSEENFSDIHAAIREFQDLFDYHTEIEAYVYEQSTYNALLLPLLRRKFILLNSDVLANAGPENEVRWLVARFVGGLASKHYRFAWLQVIISSIEKIIIFNLLLYPYERAIVKSGDQLGLFAIDGDLESAVAAVQKTMVGGALGERINLAGILSQDEAIGGSFFAWLVKCMSPFPHATSRLVNLLRYAGQRHPLQLEAFLADEEEATRERVRRAIGHAGPADVAEPLEAPA